MKQYCNGGDEKTKVLFVENSLLQLGIFIHELEICTFAIPALLAVLINREIYMPRKISGIR